MRFIGIILAAMLVLASVPALGQQEEPIEVPATGYEATRTLTAGEPWEFYHVHVDMGCALLYDFKIVGTGNFSVYLSPVTDPNNYYVDYSSAVPVTEFSRTFPANYGFAADYFIEVNSTSSADVQYTVSIRTEEVPVDYTLYYVLIVVGFIALVIFSYKFVEWQDKKEREAKKADRRGKKRK